MRASLLTVLLGALAAQRTPPIDRDPARAFFATPTVVLVRITLAPDQRQQLRDRPREYATASLVLAGRPFPAAAIKLKGAAGSFGEIDARPAFTVHLGKHGGKARLHGLERFHLNNGVQDETRACEWLGHDVFAAAGLPAPRVAHAHVWLDGADLGLYVLREAFDRQFLERTFGTAAGNLYEGGFCQDVDQALEQDAGDGADDHADLRRLAAACRDADRPAHELRGALDVAAFLDFAALEAMLGHWDGYCRSKNNYRLWLPANGTATFLPHGMDQLFGDAEASVLDHPSALVASAVLQQPALRRRYRERLRALLPLFAPERLLPRLQQPAVALQRHLRTHGPARAREHADAMRALGERIRHRHASLAQQIDAADPTPLQLPIGKVHPLQHWQPAPATDGIALAKHSFQATPALQLTCEPPAREPREGAWRCQRLLPRGRYELRAVARCERVVARAAAGDDDGHRGAWLCAGDERSVVLAGDRGWQTLSCEFEVAEFQRDVELACELRALGGRAWFRIDSLQLVRLR